MIPLAMKLVQGLHILLSGSGNREPFACTEQSFDLTHNAHVELPLRGIVRQFEQTGSREQMTHTTAKPPKVDRLSITIAFFGFGRLSRPFE